MTTKENRPGNEAASKSTGRTDTDPSGSDDLIAAAVEYAQHHWQIFPLRGKVPAIAKSRGGRGLLDATDDVDQVIAWWSGFYRGANIGGRVPESLIVLDIDPYHGGEATLTKWVAELGELPTTYTHISGRGDGGRHLFFRHPGGKLTAKRLRNTGIDLRTHANYTVLPPSRHPDTGQPYSAIDAPVADPTPWLVGLLRPVKTVHRIRPAPPRSSLSGRLGGRVSGSIADRFTETATWAEILMSHGWACLDPDLEADGARWVHPTATAKWSATIKYGLLFVYSTNTPFEVTEAGTAHGYTKFRAYAVLNHHGDLSAAARALKAVA